MRGPNKAQFKDFYDGEKPELVYPAKKGYWDPDLEPGQCKGSIGEHLGLFPWVPGGHSPKKKHGSVLMWAHNPQEDPWRSGAMWMWWQSKAGFLVVQSPVADAGLEHGIFSDGEGT